MALLLGGAGGLGFYVYEKYLKKPATTASTTPGVNPDSSLSSDWGTQDQGSYAAASPYSYTPYPYTPSSPTNPTPYNPIGYTPSPVGGGSGISGGQGIQTQQAAQPTPSPTPQPSTPQYTPQEIAQNNATQEASNQQALATYQVQVQKVQAQIQPNYGSAQNPALQNPVYGYAQIFTAPQVSAVATAVKYPGAFVYPQAPGAQQPGITYVAAGSTPPPSQFIHYVT